MLKKMSYCEQIGFYKEYHVKELHLELHFMVYHLGLTRFEVSQKYKTENDKTIYIRGPGGTQANFFVQSKQVEKSHKKHFNIQHLLSPLTSLKVCSSTFFLFQLNFKDWVWSGYSANQTFNIQDSLNFIT